MGLIPPLRSLVSGGDAACPECGERREKSVRRHPRTYERYEMWNCSECDEWRLADSEPVEEYDTDGRPDWRRSL